MLCDLCNVAYPIGKKIAYAFGFRILADFIAEKYLCNGLDLHGHLGMCLAMFNRQTL